MQLDQLKLRLVRNGSDDIVYGDDKIGIKVRLEKIWCKNFANKYRAHLQIGPAQKYIFYMSPKQPSKDLDYVLRLRVLKILNKRIQWLKEEMKRLETSLDGRKHENKFLSNTDLSLNFIEDEIKRFEGEHWNNVMLEQSVIREKMDKYQIDECLT